MQRVMVVDLDVHQGNGVGRDKLHFHDSDLYILDMYNSYTFPLDTPAKAAINTKVSGTHNLHTQRLGISQGSASHQNFAQGGICAMCTMM